MPRMGPAAGPAGLTTTIVFIHRGPGPPFGLFRGNAALLIALGYVVGLAFLLVSIFAFIASWHVNSLGLRPAITCILYMPARLACMTLRLSAHVVSAIRPGSQFDNAPVIKKIFRKSICLQIIRGHQVVIREGS